MILHMIELHCLIIWDILPGDRFAPTSEAAENGFVGDEIVSSGPIDEVSSRPVYRLNRYLSLPDIECDRRDFMDLGEL